MSELIEHLKQKHWLWQGNAQNQPTETYSTGFALLDSKLEGGFPKHGVIELQSDSGIGELRLLLPHLLVSSEERMSVFIQPPGYLCAEMLVEQGFDLNQILLIYPETPQHALWAAEQCLKSGACSNVLLWQSELEVHQARRLQVASETGHCLHFLFKQAQQDIFSLPVSLSMRLEPHNHGLTVTITKRKGGWSHGSFVLDMRTRWSQLAVTQPEPVVIPFPLRKQG
ncbi:translesion DNA synthesis-associated protein ImuA [Vibrio ponticus]|uniref:Translesion DNA synthesis-associated protein ImuA n=1 Tax=Vibrio ponticus TaxID=265668 RepID=A0A3N3DYG3_9VIBR|nr:translesion DNA synthesis-associated protein ImuA [Vibrio ponticus]ROV59426.1 translesion DNA synthesis-associated protein ImuA [Vibrio ponticus]